MLTVCVLLEGEPVSIHLERFFDIQFRNARMPITPSKELKWKIEKALPCS